LEGLVMHKNRLEEDVPVTIRLPRRILKSLDAKVAKLPKYASRNHAITIAISQMIDRENEVGKA